MGIEHVFILVAFSLNENHHSNPLKRILQPQFSSNFALAETFEFRPLHHECNELAIQSHIRRAQKNSEQAKTGAFFSFHMNKLAYLYSVLNSIDFCVTTLMQEMSMRWTGMGKLAAWEEKNGQVEDTQTNIRRTGPDLRLWYSCPRLSSSKWAQTALSSCCCFTSCLNWR